jgi:hypothetical protein
MYKLGEHVDQAVRDPVYLGADRASACSMPIISGALLD